MSLSQRPDTLTDKQTNNHATSGRKTKTPSHLLQVCMYAEGVEWGRVGLGEGSSELVRSEVLQMPDRGSLDDSGIVKQA